MPATITHTHRPLLHRMLRRLRIWWLHYEINSAEQWIAACEADGITHGTELHYQRKAVAALRVQLAMAEAA